MGRWIVILGGIEIVGGGIVTAFPEFLPQWVGFIAIAIGVGTIAFGVWGANRPRPAYYGVPTPDKWIWNWNVRVGATNLFPMGRIVSLHKAARIAYEKTHGTKAAEVAEKLNPDNVLEYYAHALFNGSTTLFGSRHPSTKLGVVPNDEYGRCGFNDDLSAIRRHGDDRNLYENIYIRRSDLRRLIKELRRLS